MTKEAKFDELLIKAGFLSDYKVFIPYFKEPDVKLEVDNFGLKHKTLFIFEGKSKNIKNAVSQLKDQYESFRFNKELLSKRFGLKSYAFIRTFYYSFNKHEIKELDKKGSIIFSYKFNNSEELLLILRKL